jgi:hypothetical protein
MGRFVLVEEQIRGGGVGVFAARTLQKAQCDQGSITRHRVGTRLEWMADHWEPSGTPSCSPDGLRMQLESAMKWKAPAQGRCGAQVLVAAWTRTGGNIMIVDNFR